MTEREYRVGARGRLIAVPTSAEVAWWQRTFPELSSRPALVAAMVDYPGFRRSLFRIFTAIDNICHIPDPKLAVHVLNVYGLHARRKLDSYHWEHRDHMVQNQLMAALKNRLWNAHDWLLPGRQVAPVNQPHFVPWPKSKHSKRLVYKG